ncbi:MAG: hypothetical protein LH616_05990 [Ilumatobacteraceae bacterium]|nr:hypothetical protein [Ilumatobacteraceae bacterium]
MSSPADDTPPSPIVRLVGVYDADSTLRGEVTYWIGARLGRAHCSLCDITHGLARERREWKVCRAGLPVRFDTYHRDDQPHAIRVALDGVVPAVVAETETGVVILVGPETLDECAGSTDRLVTAIERAVDNAGMRWPDPQ